MKKKRTGTIVLAAAIAGIVLFCLIYTRPWTVERRYPYLDLSQCVKIEGYCSPDGMLSDQVPFRITPEDAGFDDLIGLVRSAAFRTDLKNLLPKGTRTHRYAPGDFMWEAEFSFEDVHLPDGSVSSGEILCIENYFGDLTCIVSGKIVSCSVKNEPEWIQQIMNIILPYTEK